MPKLHNTELAAHHDNSQEILRTLNRTLESTTRESKHSCSIEMISVEFDPLIQLQSLRGSSPVVWERKTITQQGNIGTAHNPRRKHHEAEARKLRLGYFLPFEPIRTDSRWMFGVWGAKRETFRCEEELATSILWSFSWMSVAVFHYSRSMTDFIKAEILSRWILINEGLIGPRLIEWKLDEANQVRDGNFKRAREEGKWCKGISQVKQFSFSARSW